MNKFERLPNPLGEQVFSNSKEPLSRGTIKKVGSLLPVAGFFPLFTKESTIFTQIEWDVLRAGFTAIAVSSLILAEVFRRRTIEPSSKFDKTFSKAAMILRTVGVGAALYAIWNIDKI